MSTLDRQKQLKKFLDRRHPLYEEMEEHWEFLSDTYQGGRDWFDDNVFRYIKEGDKEYSDRVQRAYRFNHTREVVDLVIKYLFKMQVERSEDIPDYLKDFWKSATRAGQSIRDYIRSVATESSTYGRVWVVIDTNKTQETKSKAEDKALGAKVYAYTVCPEHVLDMSYDDKGALNWILICEAVRDDADPIYSSGEIQHQYRLWEKNQSTVFRKKKEGNKVTIIEEAPVPHDLGFVPVLNADNVLSEEKYTSTSMIADVAYLDRAVANYLSNLDAIIQDQTFSQLAMPHQGVEPGKEYDALLTMGTKRIFLFDGGEGGNQPFYLSPDVKQAELILKVINKIINEIYHSVGLAGERTKEDNALGIDNSSGVAKAYDFERVNSLLAAKADSLESIENRIAAVVCAYNGDTSYLDGDKEAPVLYPDDFDVRGLYDEFEIAARMALIEAPDEMRRFQMEAVIDKLFPRLKKDLRDAMVAELKSWPPKLDPLDPAAAGGNSPLKKTGNQALSSKLVAGAKKNVSI